MKQLTFNRLDALDYSCSEALNTLCTNLSFTGSNVKKIMITSCQPREGKSFLAMNLMRALTGIGKRVVLVDADLRRSTHESRYAIKSTGEKVGLSHYLAGLCAIEDIVYKTNIEGAYMVLCGKDVANSLALLSVPGFSELLDWLGANFDVVLIDSPPVGVIIDAAMIAKSCDGVLFVVSNDVVSRRELIDAKNQIVKTGCPILGCVMNKVSFESKRAKSYYYKTYYSYYSRGNYRRDPARKQKADPDKSLFVKRRP